MVLLCAASDCHKPAKGRRGWCNAHYKRWHKHGDPLGGSFKQRAKGLRCLRQGCERPVHARSLCSAHYMSEWAAARPVCEVEECVELSRAGALCGRHYAQRARLRGPEAARAANRRWARNQSPEKRRRWNVYNRDRRRAALCPDELSHEYDTVLCHDPCAYCGATGESVDHIDPVVAGGGAEWENLTAACISCNARKHTRPLLHFLLRERVSNGC